MLSVVLLVSGSVFSQLAKAAQASGSQTLKYEPLNMKLGLWERTSTFTKSGEMPIPAEVLNRLTPEQRARIEERAKANSAAHNPNKHRQVLRHQARSGKDFQFRRQGMYLDDPGVDQHESQGKRFLRSFRHKSNGNGEFEAPDPEHLNGSMHITSTGGGHNMKIDTTFTSKWLGGSCGSVQ